MNRPLLALVALLAMSTTALAGPYGYYPGRQYAPPIQGARPAADPAQIVRRGIGLLRQYMAKPGKKDPAEVEAFLDAKITQFFDFPYMARWAGGAAYRKMNDAQRERLAEKLKGLFFAALARNLGGFAGGVPPRVNVYPIRSRGYNREVTARARVVRGNGRVVKLDFRFYRGPKGWRIFDVTANGTSAVVYFRKYFNQLLRQRGVKALYD